MGFLSLVPDMTIQAPNNLENHLTWQGLLEFQQFLNLQFQLDSHPRKLTGIRIKDVHFNIYIYKGRFYKTFIK